MRQRKDEVQELPRYVVLTHDQADCHQSHVVIIPGGHVVVSFDDEESAVERARWLNQEIGL
jgi:hypothetical protein